MKKNKVDSLRHREIRTGYLMIAPLMSGVIVFFIWAFFQNVYYSFTNKSSFGIPKFVGLENYVKLFHDEAFYQAFINTILYVVICVPAVVILAILLAVLLNSKVKGIGFFRVCIFLPAVTLPAAIGLLWKWLMNYKFGIFNEILGKFGANGIQRFFKITLPLLSPSIFFVCVTTVINVFQIFDFIYLMIPQGSSGTAASRSLVTYFFEQSFVKFHKGYGAAISLVLFFLILVITAIQMICQKKLVFYDD